MEPLWCATRSEVCPSHLVLRVGAPVVDGGEELKDVVFVFAACIQASLDRRIKGPLILDKKLVVIQTGA